jgi:hypothetical protein
MTRGNELILDEAIVRYYSRITPNEPARTQ